MDTLIEIYDENAIENVIGVETFRPRRVIYLCPDEVARDLVFHQKLSDYFRRRQLDVEVIFLPSNRYDTEKIARQLKDIFETYPDCALDVTGGSDAGIVAAGMFCAFHQVPTFTYSRKRNKFYDIRGAAFAQAVPCELSYSVEDFFRMTGGSMRPGRVDNSRLQNYLPLIGPFFDVFLKYRREWVEAITFFQRISRVEKGMDIPLHVTGSLDQKGERGSRVYGNPRLMQELQEIGFLTELDLSTEGSVSMTFRDEQVRAWLRDVGSALEIFTYKACLDTGIFQDVVSSAIVDWDGTVGHDAVSNEIDVIAARGIIPIFISCKACEVKTEALNELAILRDRFGGKGAKATIVTTETCNAATRHRAAQLSIAVIDLEELEQNAITDRLKAIMKASS